MDPATIFIYRCNGRSIALHFKDGSPLPRQWEQNQRKEERFHPNVCGVSGKDNKVSGTNAAISECAVYVARRWEIRSTYMWHINRK